MAIQGMRDTSTFIQDQRPLHWRAKVLMLYPNGSTPLFALTSGMKTEVVDDPQFNWWEKPMQARRFALDADLDATGGTENITIVEDGQTLKEGDLLLVENTGEILFVAADPTAADTVSVTRAFAGSVAATAVDYDGAGVNPNLLLIGSAYEEGSDSPTGVNFDPTKKYNYTQIYRNTLESTRTAMRTRLRTGDQMKEARRECLELHSRDIEWSFFLGERKETTKNGKPLRTTGGIKSFLPASRKVNVGGSVDMETLENYMETIFQYGSSEKVMFTGNRALTAINRCIRRNTAYQIMGGEKEYGMNVMRLICPFGTLVIKTHPMFNQVSGGTTTAVQYYGLNSSAFVLDMANFVYRHMKGDDTRYQEKLQNNGIDGEKSGYLTEAGLEVHHPETHFFMEGLNDGVADS